MPQGTGRITELDALRGIAASCVLLYHYTSIYPRMVAHRTLDGIPQMWFGYFGVELFFMISGFVIFFTASRASSIRDFFISRFSRLFPAYWVSVLVAAAINRLASVENHGFALKDTLANLTMLQTYIGFANMNGSYWTLAYEVAFYVLIVVALRVTVARGVRIEWALLAWLSMATLLRYGDIHVPYRMSIALMLYYGQFFVFGISTYLIYSGLHVPLTFLVAAWSLMMSGFGANTHTPASGFENYFAMSTVCGAVIVYSLWCRPRVLSSRVLQFLGRISYSLYLTHRPIGYYTLNEAHKIGLTDLTALTLTAAFAVAVGFALNVTVERPGRVLLHNWLTRKVVR